jgi:hypothetical protein
MCVPLLYLMLPPGPLVITQTALRREMAGTDSFIEDMAYRNR